MPARGLGQATVCRINSIRKHPNADRLEQVDLTMHNDGIIDVTVVTGQHYKVGQRGVWISPGSKIPGYLAEELWLVGRGGTNQWLTVVEKNMRGIVSPGLFCGETYQPDRSSEWIPWTMWRKHWRHGEDVSAFLGIR